MARYRQIVSKGWIETSTATKIESTVSQFLWISVVARPVGAQGQGNPVDHGDKVKADQKARGRYLGGKVPFGFRRGDEGEFVPHEAEQEAIREMVALRAQGKALRAIAEAMRANP